MKEYKSEVGGRYTYADDLLNLQDLALSSATMFVGLNNFIISGCQITPISGTLVSISDGYVWINGKIRKYTGTSSVDLASGYYMVENNTVESVKYTESATKAGRNVYGVVGQTMTPSAGLSYIYITPQKTAPNLSSEFFGKFSMLLNPSTSKQTILKDVDFTGKAKIVGDLSLNSNMLMSRVGDVSNRTITQSLGASDFSITQLYGSSQKNKIALAENGDIVFYVGATERLRVNSSGIVTPNISTSSQSSADIVISSNDIYRGTGTLDSDSIRINYNGYNGSNSYFRGFDIYNGKNALMASFSGINNNFRILVPVINSHTGAVGLTLKSSSNALAEEAYMKRIEFTDKNDIAAGIIGFDDSTNRNLYIRNKSGAGLFIEASSFVTNCAISENGTFLTDKYAQKSALDALAGNVVMKDGSKVLSDVNFSTAYRDKLDSIAGGVIDPGSQGFVTGEDVAAALTAYMQKSKNLSDIQSVDLARDNLSVYSRDTSDNRYLIKSENLSGINADIARANLGVYSKSDVYNKEESYPSTSLYTKTESDTKYQTKLKVVPWTPVNSNGKVIYARQYGDVVTIMGEVGVAGVNEGGSLFQIPNAVDPPPYNIGGVGSVQIGDVQYNRGLEWACAGGTRNVYAKRVNGAEPFSILITYLI